MLTLYSFLPCPYLLDETYRQVFENAPIGLQLIGHRFQEEELLGTLDLLEEIIGNRK